MSNIFEKRGRWHHTILENMPTCYVDYNNEDFVIHIKYPFGSYNSNTVWYYPCVMNNKPLRLIHADESRMGSNAYGDWAVHYI